MDAQTLKDAQGRSWTVMDAHGRFMDARMFMDGHGRSDVHGRSNFVTGRSRDGHATVTFTLPKQKKYCMFRLMALSESNILKKNLQKCFIKVFYICFIDIKLYSFTLILNVR